MPEAGEKQISNNSLARFISLDFLIVLVLIGIAWGVNSTKVASLEEATKDHRSAVQEQVNDLRMEQKQIRDMVYQSNRKLDVIEERQRRTLEEQRQRGEQQDEILKILREQQRQGQ